MAGIRAQFVCCALAMTLSLLLYHEHVMNAAIITFIKSYINPKSERRADSDQRLSSLLAISTMTR